MPIPLLRHNNNSVQSDVSKFGIQGHRWTEFGNRSELRASFKSQGVQSLFGWRVALFTLALLLSGCAQNQQKSRTDAEKSQNESTLEGPYTRGDDDGATVVSYSEYRDPIQPINRVFFKFNDVLYRYALSPLGRGYIKVTPEPVDRSLGNFFNNLREPLFSINHLLQGQFKESGKSLVRLGVNSTLGLLGLFDPADRWLALERDKTTFGETLATYGVGYGAYFVIPVLGPSSLRDGATMAFEYLGHPVHYLLESPDSTAYFVFEGFHDLADTLEKYPDIVKDTKDPYTFIRNFYLQRLMRDDDALLKDIKDGAPTKRQ